MIQINDRLIERILQEIKSQLQAVSNDFIRVGISNRHVHLCPEDLAALFGPGYALTRMKELSQPGEFAAEEVLTITGPKRSFRNVRILGPVRARTQVEISISDSFALGIKPLVRASGDVEGAEGIVITGPKGSIKKEESVIVAQRHIHMPPGFAGARGIKDGDLVCVKTDNNVRQLVFGKVLARVSDKYALEMHVDVEEANAAGLRNGDIVSLVDCSIME
jgi:putative phosphotransacetylase